MLLILREELFVCCARYVGKGKGILQRHHLTEEMDDIVKEDEGMQKLSESSFMKVLQSAQVNLWLHLNNNFHRNGKDKISLTSIL